jgi:two-component system, sporulation sensor kinase E
LQIFISDTGCGIPREKLKDIFEDYRTTKRRGLGLGLAICKKLTEEMRGSIRIESEEGKGTVAHLRFPAA